MSGTIICPKCGNVMGLSQSGVYEPVNALLESLHYPDFFSDEAVVDCSECNSQVLVHVSLIVEFNNERIF